jgi:predicted tellurium resistance membrane protein TerC
MQTSVHRHQPPAAAPARHPTLRLGTVVSVIAVAVSIVLRALFHVPEAALVVAVMIVAFGFSWHVTWRDEGNEFTRS